MPTEPEHASASFADDQKTAILDAVPSAPAPVGYGDRFAEDAFDYPSSAAQDWSAKAAPAPEAIASATAAAPQPVPQARRTGHGGARGANGWQQAAVRHRSALTAAAAVLLLGGFGFALSTVSDTVSSDPTPGSTAQVSAPKSPTGQPLPPDASATAEPGTGAGASAAPTPASPLPGTGEDRGRDQEHGPNEPGREDGDDADD
ncbi:hypothetical protein ABZ656_51200 [Streptomyces sp. NPDC007095]|jgi:hypothetical protein|uniref:hypothetical protein n=1 Tax=Streptomyces sp. NPDC007095 TaxID=3154482 RepID=UPI000C7105F2